MLDLGPVQVVAEHHGRREDGGQGVRLVLRVIYIYIYIYIYIQAYIFMIQEHHGR
jgi:hypothetical protein